MKKLFGTITDWEPMSKRKRHFFKVTFLAATLMIAMAGNNVGMTLENGETVSESRGEPLGAAKYEGRIDPILYEACQKKTITTLLTGEGATVLIHNKDESIESIVNNNPNIKGEYKDYIVNYYHKISSKNPNTDFCVFKENIRRLKYIGTVPNDVYIEAASYCGGASLTYANSIVLPLGIGISTIEHELSHLHSDLYFEDTQSLVMYQNFGGLGSFISEGLAEQFRLDNCTDGAIATSPSQREAVKYLCNILGKDVMMSNFLKGDVFSLIAIIQEKTQLDRAAIRDFIRQCDSELKNSSITGNTKTTLSYYYLLSRTDSFLTQLDQLSAVSDSARKKEAMSGALVSFGKGMDAASLAKSSASDFKGKCMPYINRIVDYYENTGLYGSRSEIENLINNASMDMNSKFFYEGGMVDYDKIAITIRHALHR